MRGLCFLLCGLTSTSWALDPFFQQKSQGWHWYEARKQVEEDKAAETRPQATPTEIINAQRARLEQSLHAAIVEPTSLTLKGI